MPYAKEAPITTPARSERLEFRTTPETRRLVERAVAASRSTLTEFAETSLRHAAQRTLADRTVFDLTPDAGKAWAAINKRPARDLPGLRTLLDKPSPFAD